MENEAFQNRHPGLDPGSSTIDLTVITTGGTIDGADCDKGTLRPTSDAVKWLSYRTQVKVTHNALFNKDSRQITAEDRELLINTIACTDSNLVLITHGTFTICETGRALKQSHTIDPQKKVFLVGAWTPFGEPETDAPDQMAFALESLASGPFGIFVAMDGKLWNPETTNKYQAKNGRFYLSDKSQVPPNSHSNPIASWVKLVMKA